METDKEETTNVYEEHPEVVAELTALLEKYEREGRSAPVMAKGDEVETYTLSTKAG